MQSSTKTLPLIPLLHNYLSQGLPTLKDLRELPDLGPRFRAISSASVTFLYDNFLDRSTPEELARAVLRFYRDCAPLPLHEDRIEDRIGIIRHALAHLARCPDPWAEKLDRCLLRDGAYFVAGAGPLFWSSLLQGLNPDAMPAWTPATIQGLRRLGMLDQPSYSALLRCQSLIRAEASSMTALHIEHFLTLVSRMTSRHLPTSSCKSTLDEVIASTRSQTSTRSLLKERGQDLAQAQTQIEEALRQQSGLLLKQALSALESRIDWNAQSELLTLWIGRFWETDEPYELLSRFLSEDPIPGAGLSLPASVLALRDPQCFLPWHQSIRQGCHAMDDSLSFLDDIEQYRLANETAVCLREQCRLHPFEVPTILARLGEKSEIRDDSFSGFCPDTFRFFADLSRSNTRHWMDRQRDRYQFVLREPIVELCQILTERYVEPVLCRDHGWELETEAKTGKALTSICKNDYGQSNPYCTEQWIVFSRRRAKPGARREGAQLFVRVDESGAFIGLRANQRSLKARKQLQRRIETSASSLIHALRERGAVGRCQIDIGETRKTLESTEDLIAWAQQKEACIGISIESNSPILQCDELVGEIVLMFDRLLPLFAFLEETSSTLWQGRSAGEYSMSDFQHDTFQSADWLEHACNLLEMKGQLILQGAPGTGKTHLARCLARYLTQDRAETVQMVQFHPAYAYEELIEGIKVRTVETEGRHEVTYPVEQGVLCTFAEQAAREPSQPHVLIIDEINRGNLPRIFGEMLFLLEYRDQSVTLPYSRRAFRLPNNLYLLGTMNTADRSITPLDRALRRRFSFMEMRPDARVLRAWLKANPPSEGVALIDSVVSLFEALNARISAELGDECQVGHSYFMVPNLSASRLSTIWEHQIAPLIREQALMQSRSAVAESLLELLAEVQSGAGF